MADLIAFAENLKWFDRDNEGHNSKYDAYRKGFVFSDGLTDTSTMP